MDSLNDKRVCASYRTIVSVKQQEALDDVERNLDMLR